VESPVIKFLLVPAVVLAVLLSLRSRASLRGQARRKIVAALTIVAGVVAVLVPDTLQVLADAVGVGRGTDLLLYMLGIVTIYLVGSTSARFREQEAKLARLSRQVALADTEARLAVRSPASRTRSTDVPSPESAAPGPGRCG
jgi:small membrane protein